MLYNVAPIFPLVVCFTDKLDVLLFVFIFVMKSGHSDVVVVCSGLCGGVQ